MMNGGISRARLQRHQRPRGRWRLNALSSAAWTVGILLMVLVAMVVGALLGAHVQARYPSNCDPLVITPEKLF